MRSSFIVGYLQVKNRQTCITGENNIKSCMLSCAKCLLIESTTICLCKCEYALLPNVSVLMYIYFFENVAVKTCLFVSKVSRVKINAVKALTPCISLITLLEKINYKHSNKNLGRI